jgi:CRP-like cAMP-binding protein
MTLPEPDASRVAVADFLRRQALFAELPATDLDELARQARRVSLEPGQIIFLAGEPSAGLWIVESGTVKVYKLAADGREHILHLLGPGEVFNDIAAIDGLPNPANTAALSAAAVWRVPAAALSEALLKHQALALAAVRALAARVRHLLLQIEDLALRSVTARLARFLLEQGENPSLASPAVTRATIATYLATTPESVSRALRVLEEVGAIRFDRHQIVIVRPSVLRDIAML